MCIAVGARSDRIGGTPDAANGTRTEPGGHDPLSRVTWPTLSQPSRRWPTGDRGKADGRLSDVMVWPPSSKPKSTRSVRPRAQLRTSPASATTSVSPALPFQSAPGSLGR